MGGLGPLPVLARMALLPRTRSLLSARALRALEALMFGWLSPRSKVAWAGAALGWTCCSKNGGSVGSQYTIVDAEPPKICNTNRV